MAKYFPDKPADVTCATCPYLHLTPESQVAPRACVVRSPVSALRSRGSDEYAIALPWHPGTASWCGEHPWFVEQRVLLEKRR